MTAEQMKAWIDSASYEELLRKWRFEPCGSPWFEGEVGEHFNKVMARRSADTPNTEKVAASKRIGWGS